jgi:hypothetical protein
MRRERLCEAGKFSVPIHVANTANKRRVFRVEALENPDDDGTGGVRRLTQSVLTWLVLVATVPGG